MYRAGGWLAFTRLGAAAVLIFSGAGLVAWVREVISGRHSLVTVEGSYVLGLVVLIVLQVLSISVHEAGHALAIRHYGRRVRRLGLAIYYLFPCMYVDSTDMTMAPRHQRIIVSLRRSGRGHDWWVRRARSSPLLTVDWPAVSRSRPRASSPSSSS